MLTHASPGRAPRRSDAGFSMVDLLVSVALLLIISGIVMQALQQMTTAQGMVANRTNMHTAIRSATSLLQQEVGQAGRVSLPNPNSLPNPVWLTSSVTGTGLATVTVNSAAGIFQGEQLVVAAGDTAADFEEETVTVTQPPTTNSFTAVFAKKHAVNAAISVRGGFASGVVPKLPALENGTSLSSGSTDWVLKIYGDINGDGKMVYVEYKCDTAAGLLYRNVMDYNAASKPPLSPANVLLNIQPNPGNAPCFTYDQDTVDGTTYVLVVGVTLTVATTTVDPVTHLTQTETVSLLNVAPRNVFDVWQLRGLSVNNRVQPMPASVRSLLP